MIRIALPALALLAACEPGDPVGRDGTLSVVATSRSEAFVAGEICEVSLGGEAATFATPALLAVPSRADGSPAVDSMSCTHEGVTLPLDQTVRDRTSQVEFRFQ